MTGPKSSRCLCAALVLAIALLLVPAYVAVAKTQSHKPKCRAHYTAKRVRVRKRKHHRLVWVRQWKCVKKPQPHPHPHPSPPPSPSPSPAPLNCAGTPGSGIPNDASLDACGYPSPDTTGVPAGTSLTPSGSITARTPGEVLSGLAVNGTIEVAANNVTIEDTDVAESSSCCWGIRIDPGVTGTVVRYDTIHGTDDESGSLAWAVDNAGDVDAVTEDHVYSYNADRILNGPGTVTNSYCLDNANISGDHYECVYTGAGSVIINHDTLLNPHGQTGATWVGEDFGDIDTYTVENSILAGGGYTLYGAAAGAGDPGTLIGPVTIENNRFSRLYFAHGGYWGPAAWFDMTKTTWSGNVWDDTNRSVSP
jgi:hypothetical protein